MKIKHFLLLPLLATSVYGADYFNMAFGIDKVLPNLNGSVSQEVNRLDINNGEEPAAITDQFDNSMMWVDIKHPIPVIPNIRIEKTRLNIGSIKQTEDPLKFEYNGIDYSYDGETKQTTSTSLEYMDFTPYYNILDESLWLTLNVGVTIREVEAETYYEVEQYVEQNGEKTLLNSLSDTKVLKKTYLPLAYINTRVDIPNSNFTVEGTYRGVKYQDNGLHEVKLGLEYTTDCGPGARIGYQESYLNSDSFDNYVIDMNLQTFYVGIFARF